MFFLLPVLLLQAVISVRTELVAVPVTVTDAHGAYVRGLTQDQFRVFVDGRPQPIAAFHHGDVTVTLGLIVDFSQSMRSKREALLIAVAALLRSNRTDDELFAVGFNDRVALARAGASLFTNDVNALTSWLTAVPAEGRTALYDGVAEGLKHLERGHGERRALILVSDGGDNASERSYAEVLALARRSDAVIYAVGLLGTPPAQEEEDAGLLKRLCRDTGGLAYFPHTSGEVAAFSAEIASDLREQYLLGFVPGDQNGRDAFRKIEVRVTPSVPGRLRVRTRAGYIASRAGEKEKDNP